MAKYLWKEEHCDIKFIQKLQREHGLTVNCFTSVPFADIESSEELNSAFNYLGVNPENDSGVGPDLHKDK